MTDPTQPDIHPFIRKVQSVALVPLSEEETAALAALPMQVASFEAYADIVREHERPGRSFAVLSGITATSKTTRAGKRQVMAYNVAGDVPDFQSLHLQVLDVSIAAVTPCRIGFVRHDVLRALFRRYPRLAETFWRATLIDAAIVREWMLNNGRRESFGRLAHLFCELLTRLEAVGLARADGCELGLTQQELGDALGISTVHVSRTMKELREAGLVTLSGGRLTVHDRARLAAAAEFDPTYLHLRDPNPRDPRP